jgi:hypothetical protein
MWFSAANDLTFELAALQVGDDDDPAEELGLLTQMEGANVGNHVLATDRGGDREGAVHIAT